jgi:hypothetical protein
VKYLKGERDCELVVTHKVHLNLICDEMLFTSECVLTIACCVHKRGWEIGARELVLVAVSIHDNITPVSTSKYWSITFITVNCLAIFCLIICILGWRDVVRIGECEDEGIWVYFFCG